MASLYKHATKELSINNAKAFIDAINSEDGRNDKNSVILYAVLGQDKEWANEPSPDTTTHNTQTLEYDISTIKEAGKRALGRYTLGLNSVGYYKTLQNILDTNDVVTNEERASSSTVKTKRMELIEGLHAFLKYFTSAKLKVSDYESPPKTNEWNDQRSEISKRFSKAGITPKGHPWCPQSCNDVLNEKETYAVNEKETKLTNDEYTKLVQWVTKRDDGKKDDDNNLNEDELSRTLNENMEDDEDGSNGNKEEGITDESISKNIDQFIKLASIAS